MKNLPVGALLVATLSSPAILLAAQQAIAPRGTIAVLVLDQDGKPLPGAAVTLIPDSASQPRPHVEITPASGAISFGHLAQGTYSLKCELSGFFTTILEEVPVELEHTGPRLPDPIKIVLTVGPIWY